MYNAVVGVNLETRKICARAVRTCGYCGNVYPADRIRCGQCHSQKVANSGTKSE